MSCIESDPTREDFELVPGGRFILGQHPQYPEESSDIKLHVADLLFSTHEVTNAEFNLFVEATGYLTDAEKTEPKTGLKMGSAVFQSTHSTPGWWQLDRSANWRNPEGAGSTLDGKGSNPVVHVSLADAQAYAKWKNARIPTEIEWEYAAQTGLRNPSETSSGAYASNGEPLANTWQGFFPISNSASDGFIGTAPVGCYPKNEVGLYDMIGNVWEWTTSPHPTNSSYTIKGGSYLCSDNFCRRYRPQARQWQDRHFSASNLGFRIVKDTLPDDKPISD